MRFFGYPYNDLVISICKDSPDYLPKTLNIGPTVKMKQVLKPLEQYPSDELLYTIMTMI